MRVMPAQLKSIEGLTSIEGIAKDVRQARTRIFSYGRAWDASYECLFRLSGTPVALRVSGPVFIDDGETVRVVGNHNLHGVFDAVAYHNRSSGVSGNSDYAYFRKHIGIATAFFGGAVALGPALIKRLITLNGLPIQVGPLPLVSLLIGLSIVLVGLLIFVRSRGIIRTIEGLLNDN